MAIRSNSIRHRSALVFIALSVVILGAGLATYTAYYFTADSQAPSDGAAATTKGVNHYRELIAEETDLARNSWIEPDITVYSETDSETTQIQWPPKKTRGRSPVADPGSDVIRWQAPPAAENIVVVFSENKGGERPHTLARYRVKNTNELALSDIALERWAMNSSTAHRESLYTVSVFAYDAEGEFVSRSSEGEAGDHRFRLKGFQIHGLPFGTAYFQDQPQSLAELQYASWQRTMRGDRLAGATRVLVDKGYYDSAKVLASQLREDYHATPYAYTPVSRSVMLERIREVEAESSR